MIITSKDLHGVLAHVLLMRKLDVARVDWHDNRFVLGANSARFESVAERAIASKPDSVHIAGLNPDLLHVTDVDQLQYIVEAAGQVHWYGGDPSVDTTKWLQSYGVVTHFDPEKSPAMLVRESFTRGGTPYDMELVRIAQSSGYGLGQMQMETLGDKLNAVLGSYAQRPDNLLRFTPALRDVQCTGSTEQLRKQWMNPKNEGYHANFSPQNPESTEPSAD